MYFTLVRSAGGGRSGGLSLNMSDPKLVSREKKIFDASGKIKDRFKLLVGVVEEEFTSQDITSMYRRRAQNVVDLYQGYVGQLGKVLTLEQALPVIEVLRRVLVVMHDSVRDGWCQEYLGDEVERYLHIENHLSIRKIGLKLLLLYIDAVGSDCLGLLLSVFDWNTLRLMSDPQPGLFLPPSVRVLTEKRHSFIPKKVGYKEDDNAQRDTMITFTEVFDFLSCTRERNPSYERIQFRWSLFKSTLAPILFPHCVHRGISFATSNIGFQGIFPGLTSIVLNSLLFPILSLETSCGVILDDVEDFLLVNYIFRHALRASPFDDLLPCYRALQIYQSWVHAPKHQTCITQKYCILESILAVFLNLQTPIPEQSAVQARLAMFEVACDIFVRLQDKGEDERSIRLWIDKAVVPVYKGADLGIQICEQAAEMVSRSLWSQILIANVQSNDLWDSLSTFLSSVLNTCGQGMSRGKGTSSSQAFQRISIQTVPHTDVVAQAVSPLVLHWRIIIGNILRQIIGHCSETAVTRPYNCLALSALDWSSVVDQTPGRRSDSPVGDVVSLNNKLSATQLGNSISMSSSDSPVEDYIQSNQVFQVMLPSSSRSANMSMNSHDDGDVPLDISTPFNLSSSNNKTVMSLHRQSESERKNISAPPETWIEKLPVEQIISLWIKLLKCLTFPGMERAIHPLHFISISHTVSDVINDLLFCSSSHRVIEPWKRGAPTQMDPPSHLLASTQRPISLQNSSVSASLVAHLAVEVQIRYLEYQLGSTCDYNISAKAIAMGSLCDLLRHGGKLPSEQLSKIKTLILRALSPGEESVTRVILYRLYPVSVSDVTHYGHTQHFLEHHHEDSISLLAPLVISIKDYVQFRGKSPTQSNTKRSKIDSETPVKTAAASTLTWCAAYASGLIAQGKNTITWPDEYESHNATVETYEEILEIIKKTLIDLTYENQPVATRITAIKGLAVAALVTLDSCKILQVLCQCILDISTDIALSAQTAIESVLLSIDATKISHESVLSEACSFLATALIVSLRHFIPTRHSVTVTESLLYSLTEVILSKPDIIDNPTILLVTDSMSYACQSKVRRSYWVPDTPKSYCDIPCIASSVQLHNGSYEYMSSSEEHLWWYNLDLTDETVLATIEGIRCTAEVAMDHLTGLFRNFPVCAATDSSTSSQAAPDIKAVGGENVYLNQNSKALITLSELPNDPKTVYLTSRTTTGRYCWELRRVGINGVKSSFPMVPDSTAGVGHGQARSQSGALIGRSRTKALHESSCLNSGCDLNNKLSQAMTDLMPSYLSEPSTGPPVHWTEQFKDCVGMFPIFLIFSSPRTSFVLK